MQNWKKHKFPLEKRTTDKKGTQDAAKFALTNISGRYIMSFA